MTDALDFDAPPRLGKGVAPLSVDAEMFQTMVEAGVFAEVDGKVELDEGTIVVAPIDGGAHMGVGNRLMMQWVPRITADPTLMARLNLWIPGGMRLNGRTVRGPDAMLAAPRAVAPKRWPSPEEVFLAIEFSDTSLRHDDGRKRRQYAQAGVREVWIVRVAKGDVRVCRGPRDDGAWHEADLHSGATMIAPLCAPELVISAGSLFEAQ